MKNDYSGIINLATMLLNSMAEEKAQEQKHLANARCKKPNFSTCTYALGRLAEREGLTPPTSEEVEELVRQWW